MSRNWLRYIKVTVGDGGGNGLDLSNFRIKFTVRQWTTQAPNISEIRVYNLSKKTMNQIADGRQAEFKRVTLEAGYQDNHGLLHAGEVAQYRIGRENPTDTFLDIFSRNGDLAYNFAVVNKTLKEGTTKEDVRKETLKAYQKIDKNIKDDYVGPDLTKFKHLIPFVMFGPARKFSREIAHISGSTWSFQNDKYQFVKNDNDHLPGDAIELNSGTGMIGMPVQTMDGIIVRALINPQFKVNGRIHINESSIQRAQFDLSYKGEASNERLPDVAKDGIYRILAIDYTGDNRGQPWYADLTCMSADPNAIVPGGQAGLGRGGEAPTTNVDPRTGVADQGSGSAGEGLGGAAT